MGRAEIQRDGHMRYSEAFLVLNRREPRHSFSGQFPDTTGSMVSTHIHSDISSKWFAAVNGPCSWIFIHLDFVNSLPSSLFK